jgi:NhaP-type Na+/H+ or K+/H+ antiporter
VSATNAAVGLAAIVVWLLVSGRAERANVSPALALVAAGVVLANGPLALIELDLYNHQIQLLAEVTLAIVLFADASRVNLKRLRADLAIPLRMLAIGLPLTMVLGVGAAVALVPGTALWVAAAIAAIVAPTDAALGAPILSDERVPQRIRRALNVESGLNDGIATPFVNVFLAAAVAGGLGSSDGVRSAVSHLVVGAVVGVVIGAIGGRLIEAAHRRDLMAHGAQPLAVLGLAGLAYAGALPLHGNGFIAAFVAGLFFGATVPADDPERTEFTQDVAEGMTLVVWFVFGAVLLVPAVRDATWGDLAFAIAALTAVRMIPVAVALTGTGLDRTTKAFVGWFGPRGLASVVFTLIAVDTLNEADGKRVLSTVGLTIALSVIAHGVTAGPFAARYGASRAEAT